MARTAKGWKLTIDTRTGIQIVRFTLNGKRHTLSTGERHLGRAAQCAARLYADTVHRLERGTPGGEAAPSVALTTPLPLDDLFARWLGDVEAQLDVTTVLTYKAYVVRLWLPVFPTLESITDSAGDAYVRDRLRKVRRKTLLKEVSALRGFLRWCKTEGHLSRVPIIESPPRTATGVEHDGGRRRKVRVELTEEEAEGIIGELPERTKVGKHPARPFFRVMYETTLRRETLFSLAAPGDYAVGRDTLVIRAEADKTRYAREVPLSAQARAALDSVCPEVGTIFARVRYEAVLHAAARRAGLSEERARHLSYHDWRHAALTHMASRTTDLAGMAYLAGHRDVTTTAKYVHGSRRAAERVLAARSGPFNAAKG